MSRINYFVQHRTGRRWKEREYGAKRRSAIAYARRASERQDDPTYVVAYEEEDGDLICIGHIAFFGGDRIETLGRT